MKKPLVTSSSGLIGSEVTTFFAVRGRDAYGADNNMRPRFLAGWGYPLESVRLDETPPQFTHYELDIRDRPGAGALVYRVWAAGDRHALGVY